MEGKLEPRYEDIRSEKTLNDICGFTVMNGAL